MQSWEAEAEKEKAGDEGHFSDTFPSSHALCTISEPFIAVPFPDFSSHFFFHTSYTPFRNLIPFKNFLALCFYFSINPDLVVFIELINRMHAPEEHPEKLNTLKVNLF